MQEAEGVRLPSLAKGFGLRRPKVGFGRLKVGGQPSLLILPAYTSGASQPKL
jgi:hypothetical protein